PLSAFVDVGATGSVLRGAQATTRQLARNNEPIRESCENMCCEPRVPGNLALFPLRRVYRSSNGEDTLGSFGGISRPTPAFHLQRTRLRARFLHDLSVQPFICASLARRPRSLPQNRTDSTSWPRS